MSAKDWLFPEVEKDREDMMNSLKKRLELSEMTPEEEAIELDQKPKNKYLREIKPGVWVDVYDVLFAWKVENPALQHLIKKALQPGERGHKDKATDMQDIVNSALRAQELENE